MIFINDIYVNSPSIDKLNSNLASIMSNGLFTKSIKGTEVADLTSYRGHLCLILANIDGNTFLSLTGIFIVNQRYIENFTAHQYNDTSGIHISLVNDNDGKYHLGSAKWGETDYINNTTMTYIVF